jgi:hypothetical protein
LYTQEKNSVTSRNWFAVTIPRSRAILCTVWEAPRQYDCNRVPRQPGLLSHKFDPADPMSVHYLNDSTSNSAEFHVDVAARKQPRLPALISPRKGIGKLTNSEHDPAWFLRELAHGLGARRLTKTLAESCSDKPDPPYYAQRTVDAASAWLWLSKGVPIADVVTMLDVRRRFEIPNPLCIARAQEIALTAERIIVRTKIARIQPRRSFKYAAHSDQSGSFLSATKRVDSATAILIDRYATFLHPSADDVVDKALNYVIPKDREFQEYLKTAQSSRVVPTLRVRWAGNGDGSEHFVNGVSPVTGGGGRWYPSRSNS